MLAYTRSIQGIKLGCEKLYKSNGFSKQLYSKKMSGIVQKQKMGKILGLKN